MECLECGEETIKLEDYSDGPITVEYCLACGWEVIID